MRRGSPANPRKCCGKKVRFTPISIMKKWAVAHRAWSVTPVNSGNQWTKAENMANTAPVDRTEIEDTSFLKPSMKVSFRLAFRNYCAEGPIM